MSINNLAKSKGVDFVMSKAEKINGYTKEEAKELIDYIAQGKKEGRALSYLFAVYGKTHGRAKGSVRNYYYNLLKQTDDERVVELLDGTSLSVEKIRAFTEDETDDAIRQILQRKARGMSVRRAIFNISQGDGKLGLRLQNKYRNLLKKQPERVERIAKELGLSSALVKGGEHSESVTVKPFLQRKLEGEINGLFERVTAPLLEEIVRLKAEIARLKEEE